MLSKVGDMADKQDKPRAVSAEEAAGAGCGTAFLAVALAVVAVLVIVL
jgi:hypothetical protein